MPFKATVSLLAVICVCYVEKCVCYPNGSVPSACESMMPGHPPNSASTTSPPFKVSASSATYRPGEVITVTVEVSNSSIDFQGFMLQARSKVGSATLWPLGKFTNISTTLFTALPCKNMENSTVTQASNVKKKKVQLTWEAPSNSNYSEIYFSATVVEDYEKFWVQLKSSPLQLYNGGNSVAGVFTPSALLFISLLSLSIADTVVEEVLGLPK